MIKTEIQYDMPAVKAFRKAVLEGIEKLTSFTLLFLKINFKQLV